MLEVTKNIKVNKASGLDYIPNIAVKLAVSDFRIRIYCMLERKNFPSIGQEAKIDTHLEVEQATRRTLII